jgi:hypothetical protein
MDKKIDVKCECQGTGFIAVADDGGEGVEHVECGQHHPAFKDDQSIDRHKSANPNFELRILNQVLIELTALNLQHGLAS